MKEDVRVTDDLLDNKMQLAAIADANFDSWDVHHDGLLSREDLKAAVETSEDVSEQAAAKILFENFDIARTQATVDRNGDLPRPLSTNESTQAYTEIFGGDTDDSGISRKDIAAINTVSSDHSIKTISERARQDEINAIGSHLTAGVASPIVGLLGGIGILAAGKYKPLRGLIGEGYIPREVTKALAQASFYTGTAMGAVELYQSGNSLLNSGVSVLEYDLKARRAMLDSMQVRDSKQS